MIFLDQQFMKLFEIFKWKINLIKTGRKKIREQNETVSLLL